MKSVLARTVSAYSSQRRVDDEPLVTETASEIRERLIYHCLTGLTTQLLLGCNTNVRK